MKRLLVAGLVTVAGCTDVMAVNEATRVPTGPRLDATTADPPKDWPVRIRNVSVSVNADYGSIQAEMEYDAYHASIGGSATVTDDAGSSSFSFAPEEKHTAWAYFNNYFGRTHHVAVRRACGTDIRANMVFRAWWKGLGSGGQFSLDDDSQPATGDSHQDPCPTEEVEHPAAGGGGGDRPEVDNHSHSVCVFRYTYDVATGAILYRRLLYCY